MSQLESSEAKDGVNDDFSDSPLFTIVEVELANDDDVLEDRWVSDMIYFLSACLPPQGLSKDERMPLVVRSQVFFLI